MNTRIHVLLLLTIYAAVAATAAAAQELELPTPLALADGIRVAGERRDDIDAARARTRAGEARPAIVSALTACARRRTGPPSMWGLRRRTHS